MKDEICKIIKKYEDENKISSDLNALFKSKNITQFKIKYIDLFDDQGYSDCSVSVAWINEDGCLNLVVDKIEWY